MKCRCYCLKTINSPDIRFANCCRIQQCQNNAGIVVKSWLVVCSVYYGAYGNLFIEVTSSHCRGYRINKYNTKFVYLIQRH